MGSAALSDSKVWKQKDKSKLFQLLPGWTRPHIVVHTAARQEVSLFCVIITVGIVAALSYKRLRSVGEKCTIHSQMKTDHFWDPGRVSIPANHQSISISRQEFCSLLKPKCHSTPCKRDLKELNTKVCANMWPTLNATERRQAGMQRHNGSYPIRDKSTLRDRFTLKHKQKKLALTLKLQ